MLVLHSPECWLAYQFHSTVSWQECRPEYQLVHGAGTLACISSGILVGTLTGVLTGELTGELSCEPAGTLTGILTGILTAELTGILTGT